MQVLILKFVLLYICIVNNLIYKHLYLQIPILRNIDKLNFVLLIIIVILNYIKIFYVFFFFKEKKINI